MKPQTVHLKNKIDEIYFVEPNDLGIPFLTTIYRRFNVYFKKMPFLFVVPLSFIGALIMYILFGYLVVRLVSLLQYGF